jgi:hypothetical protein
MLPNTPTPTAINEACRMNFRRCMVRVLMMKKRAGNCSLKIHFSVIVIAAYIQNEFTVEFKR